MPAREWAAASVAFETEVGPARAARAAARVRMEVTVAAWTRGSWMGPAATKGEVEEEVEDDGI